MSRRFGFPEHPDERLTDNLSYYASNYAVFGVLMSVGVGVSHAYAHKPKSSLVAVLMTLAVTGTGLGFCFQCLGWLFCILNISHIRHSLARVPAQTNAEGQGAKVRGRGSSRNRNHCETDCFQAREMGKGVVRDLQKLAHKLND